MLLGLGESRFCKQEVAFWHASPLALWIHRACEFREPSSLAFVPLSNLVVFPLYT